MTSEMREIGEIMNAMSAPVLIEYTGPRDGRWITRWWCFVPAKGVKYTVAREHWIVEVPEGCLPIRDVFEIKLTPEPQLPGQEALPGLTPGAEELP